MDGNNFDRLTQAVAKSTSRRGFLALIGGLLPATASGVRAAQLGPSTCGQAGDVCTMLIGCCTGFTCATSTINVNYGVCVSGGSGGTVATGTGLISPFSESIEQEVAALATDPALTATATGTTTSTIDARKAEIQARKDARKVTRDSRRSTRKTEIQSRRTSRKTERTADEEEARVAAGPLLEGQIFSRGVDQTSQSPAVETLRVVNRDIGPVSLVRIESLENPLIGQSFDDSRLPVLQVGQVFDFYSGTAKTVEAEVADRENNRFGWIDGSICKPGASSAGFRVFVSFSANSANHAYSFLCNQPFTPPPVGDTSDDEANRKRKRQKRVNQQSKQKQRKKSKRQKARKKGN